MKYEDVSDYNKEIYNKMTDAEKQIAENHPYSCAMFLLEVERVLDRYRNHEIDEKETLDLIDKIETRYG